MDLFGTMLHLAPSGGRLSPGLLAPWFQEDGPALWKGNPIGNTLGDYPQALLVSPDPLPPPLASSTASSTLPTPNPPMAHSAEAPLEGTKYLSSEVPHRDGGG